ncbi:MAG: FAD-dependent oxidoreductase [Acetobacteraceae bacterium]|nr:FAD-dependent oxidoreductase [Acetobacteraceae bacterium]
MRDVDVAVVGAGPAGLSAAIAAAEHGAGVVVFDREDRPGGQLNKQTHRFFGSEREHAGTRGLYIARMLSERARALPSLELELGATVLGYYPDRVLLVEQGDRLIKCRARTVVFATGAAERMIPFPNNDLPGIYGAGAVQTLMNLYGVRPGRRVLMVGSGNIGLIVSYQLLQAGVEVAAVVEALPRIGGYLVHASKVRRAGVSILTSATVKEAHGSECLEAATVWRLGPDLVPLPGTEQRLEVDVMCLAVGLMPLGELLWQAGCEMRYVPELGGHAPVRDGWLETTVPGLFVAGDAAGVEEASSAMLSGRLAGLGAVRRLGLIDDAAAEPARAGLEAALAALRAGPAGARIRQGLARLAGAGPSEVAAAGTAPRGGGPDPSESLQRTGVPSDEDLSVAAPPPERLRRGPVAVAECFQRIPCDPCQRACRKGAIRPFSDINDLPVLDHDRCDGCGACISRCPGLALFVVDSSGEGGDRVGLPWEFLPLPAAGEEVLARDREGRPLGPARVEKVWSARALDRTAVVWLSVSRGLGMRVRSFSPGGLPHPRGVSEVAGATGGSVGSPGPVMVCRCEGVTLEEIRRFIAEGYATMEELKRITRCGMGACQGRTCRPLVARELARATGRPLEEIEESRFRPPVKPVKLGLLAQSRRARADRPGGAAGGDARG